DRMSLEVALRGEIDVGRLTRSSAAIEPLALGEMVLPLRVRPPRWGGAANLLGRFEPVGVTHQRNHAVTAGDVLLELLQQGPPVLPEVLLNAHFRPDGAQVAGQGVPAVAELARDGGQEDLRLAHGRRTPAKDTTLGPRLSLKPGSRNIRSVPTAIG